MATKTCAHCGGLVTIHPGHYATRRMAWIDEEDEKCSQVLYFHPDCAEKYRLSPEADAWLVEG